MIPWLDLSRHHHVTSGISTEGGEGCRLVWLQSSTGLGRLVLRLCPRVGRFRPLPPKPGLLCIPNPSRTLEPPKQGPAPKKPAQGRKSQKGLDTDARSWLHKTHGHKEHSGSTPHLASADFTYPLMTEHAATATSPDCACAGGGRSISPRARSVLFPVTSRIPRPPTMTLEPEQKESESERDFADSGQTQSAHPDPLHSPVDCSTKSVTIFSPGAPNYISQRAARASGHFRLTPPPPGGTRRWAGIGGRPCRPATVSLSRGKPPSLQSVVHPQDEGLFC